MNCIAAKKETTEIKKFVSICDIREKSNFVKYLTEINMNINEITSDGTCLPANKINFSVLKPSAKVLKWLVEVFLLSLWYVIGISEYFIDEE